MTLSAEEWTAVRLSLLVAVTATAASLPLGIAVAYLLARGRFWGKSLLDTIVHLPLILPPVVTGYLLLLLFGKRGPVGEFLDHAFGVFDFHHSAARHRQHRFPNRHGRCRSWDSRGEAHTQVACVWFIDQNGRQRRGVDEHQSRS